MELVNESIDLTTDDLRVVARYAATCAETVLPIFVTTRPDDLRPRAAIDAAFAFADGAPRSKLQRTTALDAHAAARDAPTDASRESARAAGHAAAAAYLHPIPKSTQLAHILGSAACAVRAIELDAPNDPDAALSHLDQMRRYAPTELASILRRYPPAPTTGNRVAQIMRILDTDLR